MSSRTNVVVTASHQFGYVTIRTDGWIKLDTKQLDKIAKFDSSACNFHSTRGVHLVTLHLRAAQHHFYFRQVKKQFVL